MDWGHISLWELEEEDRVAMDHQDHQDHLTDLLEVSLEEGHHHRDHQVAVVVMEMTPCTMGVSPHREEVRHAPVSLTCVITRMIQDLGDCESQCLTDFQAQAQEPMSAAQNGFFQCAVG